MISFTKPDSLKDALGNEIVCQESVKTQDGWILAVQVIADSVYWFLSHEGGLHSSGQCSGTAGAYDEVAGALADAREANPLINSIFPQSEGDDLYGPAMENLSLEVMKEMLLPQELFDNT